jgi:hypothetical protein
MVRHDGVSTLCIPVATVAIAPTSITVDILCPPLLFRLVARRAVLRLTEDIPLRRCRGPSVRQKKRAKARKTRRSQKNAAAGCCGTERLREYVCRSGVPGQARGLCRKFGSCIATLRIIQVALKPGFLPAPPHAKLWMRGGGQKTRTRDP